MKSTNFLFNIFFAIGLFFLGALPSKAQNNFMDFDGNDYVNLGNPSALQITGDLTIEMWINPETLGGSTRRNPYNKAYGGEGTITLEPAGDLNFYYGQSGANAHPYQGFNSAASITAGQWVHIAVVRDLTNGLLYWYINGNLTNLTTADYSSAVAGGNTAYIGTGYTNPFNGQMDELRIWNEARSQSEILAAMNYELSGSEPGLAAYYNFNQGTCGGNNTSINTLQDQGTNNVDGTLTNFSKNGCSSNFVCSSSCSYSAPNISNDEAEVFLDFDGSDDHINLGNPSALRITGNQTIEMWLNPDNLNDRRNPFAKAYGGEGTITQETNGNLNYFYGQNGGNGSPYQGFGSGGGTVSVGSWTHVALVRDLSNGTLYWYKNGDLINSTAASYSSAVAGSNSALIGAGYVSNYDGQIDEVRIWNVARSQSEIRDNMNLELSGNESGLVAYYSFNEGSCGGDNTSISTVVDHSPNNLNGSVVNFARNGCESNWVCVTCGGYSANTLTASIYDIPTLSQWGVIILVLLVLCLQGAVIWHRRYANHGILKA